MEEVGAVDGASELPGVEVHGVDGLLLLDEDVGAVAGEVEVGGERLLRHLESSGRVLVGVPVVHVDPCLAANSHLDGGLTLHLNVL